jgi:hypothetical protein
VPVWQRGAGCVSFDATLHRQLEVLKLDCNAGKSNAQTFVYDAATGALRWHQVGTSCASDNSYYDARYLNGHLTVLAARTGAVIWQSPVTEVLPCALSGDRLMVSSRTSLAEYDYIAHTEVFQSPHEAVWRFGPDGNLAACDDNLHMVGIGPSGAVTWHTQDNCESDDSPFSFGTSTVDSESGRDIDIVSGKVLGAQPVPEGKINGVVTTQSRSGATLAWQYFQNPSAECQSGESVAFATPYGVSPLLAGVQVRDINFSLRALGMWLEDPNDPCARLQYVAWDYRGFVRWALPEQWELGGAIGSLGNDIATNGGVESSAIVGNLDENDNLALVSLP